MNRKDWLKTATLLSAGLLTKPLHGATFPLQAPLRAADFGPDFAWGVATAAYQIEGAWNVDGKGPSVWDHFTHHKSKKIAHGHTGDVACDFYHKYPKDLQLMRALGIPNYRCSIAWSRILPEGAGKVNAKGLDFYDRLIEKCLETGIKPWLTLYHWDIPQALEEKGGWINRDVIGWFREYSDIVTRRYGDRVKDWMVLNEPMAFVGLGYMLGIHAPGRKGPFKFLAAAHHASMCQAEGGRIIRANVPEANIGTTISASHITPKNDKPAHIRAARRVDALWNRLFLEPTLGLGYPEQDLPFLKYMHRYIKADDERNLSFEFDFIGLQNYTREVVKKAMIPFIRANFIKPEKRGVGDDKLTEMGWEVYPEGIYHLLKKLGNYQQIRKIIVTENGAAFPDELKNGKVRDPLRKAFLQDYLRQVLRAKREAVKVEGYFIWTFMDNFEWAEGYDPRFGLVYVDFKTQERIVKDSGLWFRDFLAGKNK